jgi:hypothetical protein
MDRISGVGDAGHVADRTRERLATSPTHAVVNARDLCEQEN